MGAGKSMSARLSCIFAALSEPASSGNCRAIRQNEYLSESQSPALFIISFTSLFFSRPAGSSGCFMVNGQNQLQAILKNGNRCFNTLNDPIYMSAPRCCNATNSFMYSLNFEGVPSSFHSGLKSASSNRSLISSMPSDLSMRKSFMRFIICGIISFCRLFSMRLVSRLKNICVCNNSSSLTKLGKSDMSLRRASTSGYMAKREA